MLLKRKSVLLSFFVIIDIYIYPCKTVAQQAGSDTKVLFKASEDKSGLNARGKERLNRIESDNRVNYTGRVTFNASRRQS